MRPDTKRPQIGQWYSSADKGEVFQVVGLDNGWRNVVIQYFDGDVDEIPSESWATLALEPVEPPEDVTGPMDEIEPDDLGYSETDMSDSDWGEALAPIRPQQEAWQDTRPEDERDTLGEGQPAEPFAADIPGAQKRLG